MHPKIPSFGHMNMPVSSGVYVYFFKIYVGGKGLYLHQI